MIELISIHIAKTGGRSFYEILKNEYGDKVDPRYKRIHYYPDKDYTNKLIHRIPQQVTVIHGHLLYEHVREIHLKYHPKVIAWMREPVERVISNYYFLMKRIREDKRDHPQKRKINYSLLEYARDSIMDKATHYLEGIDLEELFFIGFLETFDQDLKLLGKMLEWKKPVPSIHINDSSNFETNTLCPTKRHEITEEIRQEIRELNLKDVKLYEKAKALKKIQFGD